MVNNIIITYYSPDNVFSITCILVTIIFARWCPLFCTWATRVTFCQTTKLISVHRFARVWNSFINSNCSGSFRICQCPFYVRFPLAIDSNTTRLNFLTYRIDDSAISGNNPRRGKQFGFADSKKSKTNIREIKTPCGSRFRQTGNIRFPYTFPPNK